MGNLVFQAALGGTVTLVGPNTAATTSLTLPATDGSSGQPLTTNGSGALSFGTLGVAGGGTGVTSTPSNGQLLIGNGTGFTAATLTAGSGVSITNGAGAITITGSGSGAFGTDLSYVDYLLTTSSAISTNVGSAVAMQSVSLDGTNELMLLYGTNSMHAVVFNTSTNAFGTPILVRSGNFSISERVALTAISSTSVLVCSVITTALETVVLSISGSTITVNTAVATTLAAGRGLFFTANTRLVTVGSSYVLCYTSTGGVSAYFRAITVSGTTPSIGSELAYTGPSVASMNHAYAYSSSVLLYFGMDASLVYAYPISVSGTTLTGGTAATVSTTGTSICTGVLSTGRVALAYLNTTGRGAVVSLAGTVASISTAVTTLTVGSWLPQLQIFSNEAFLVSGTTASDQISVITDTAGVATVGTPVNNPVAGALTNYLSTGKVFFSSQTAGSSAYYQYGISSGAAVQEKVFQNVTSTAVVTTKGFDTAYYRQPLSGPPQSATSSQAIILRTSAGKIAPAYSVLVPFTISIDGTYPAKLQQGANPFQLTYNDAISSATAWAIPSTNVASATTIQLREITLA